MGLFNKKASPISSADFEQQLSALVICGRLSNVPKAEMATILAKHAAGLQREITHAKEQRALASVPKMHVGNI
jgi:hypothetical protein